MSVTTFVVSRPYLCLPYAESPDASAQNSWLRDLLNVWHWLVSMAVFVMHPQRISLHYLYKTIISDMRFVRITAF